MGKINNAVKYLSDKNGFLKENIDNNIEETADIWNVFLLNINSIMCEKEVQR